MELGGVSVYGDLHLYLFVCMCSYVAPNHIWCYGGEGVNVKF